MLDNALMPHRNLVKMLMLGGIPITSENKNIRSIVTILRRMECNVHPVDAYMEIMDDAIQSPEAMDMQMRNSEIYIKNQIEKGKRKESPVIHMDAICNYYNPNYAADLITKYVTGSSRVTNKITATVNLMQSNKSIRQELEVLMMQGVYDDRIADIIGNLLPPGDKVTVHHVRTFSEYYWDYKPGSKGSDHNMDALAEYFTLNGRNIYYNYHRKMSLMSPGEIMLTVGQGDEETVAHFNRVIYGITAVDIISGLKNGTRIKDQTIKLYTQAGNIMVENKKVDNADGDREIMRKIYENMEVVKKKRLSMDQLQGSISEEEPEQDMKANLKR